MSDKERTLDKYDEQIAYLKEHPGEIYRQWVNGQGLFQMVAWGSFNGGCRRGCLTMVRGNPSGYKLDNEILKHLAIDDRIPTDAESIRIKDLEVFAEYQRLFDKVGRPE